MSRKRISACRSRWSGESRMIARAARYSVAAPIEIAGLRIHPWQGIATTVIGIDACLQRSVAAGLLGELRRRWDHVVVTVPPAAESFDGIALAPVADAVALVIRADRTAGAAAGALAATVRDRGGDLLGGILVGVRDYVPRWLRQARHGRAGG